jgi:O-antigen ligase
MSKEILSTQKISIFVLGIFLLLYPNMYLASVDSLAAFAFGRLILLGIILVFSILCLKFIKIKGFLPYFIGFIGFLTLIQLFNPLEDEIIFSIMGVDYRPDGFLYQMLLIFFMPFILYNLKNIKNYANLILILSISSLLQSLIIISQYLNIPINIFSVLIDFRSPTSTIGLMGHAGFSAGFILIGIIACLINLQNKSNFLKVISGIFLIVNLFGLHMTQNRATVFSLSAALILWLIFNWKNHKMVLWLILSLVIINFGTSLFPKNAGIDRDRTDSTTLQTRIEIWKIALKILPQTWGFPLWGGGTGAMALTISDKLPVEELMPFYKKEFKLQSNENITKITVVSAKNAQRREKAFVVSYKDKTRQIYKINLDRAHNFFLDKAFNIGVFGAVLWMIFYLYPIYAFFRLPKAKRSNFELQGLIIALIAIQMYYIFWFSVMQVEPIHVVVALMAWVGIERAKAIPDPQTNAAPFDSTAPVLNAYGLSSNSVTTPQSLET